MIATHAVTATIGAYTLSVKDAKITLDDGWSPYCQVTLTCALPPEATLDTIDPRIVPSPRVLVTVTRDVGAQSRTFNLVLVEREVDHYPATMTLTCASDEQLLIDYARVATTMNAAAKTYQSSLRAILNSVVLPTIGAALQAGTADFDCTIDTDVTNLITNPSGETNATGWDDGLATTISRVTGSALYGSAHIRATLTAAVAAVFVTETATFPIVGEPGATYTWSVYVKASHAGMLANVRLRYRNAAGATLADFNSSAMTLSTTSWTRLTITSTAPALTAKLAPMIILQSATYTGRYAMLDGALLEKGILPSTYFDGATADTTMFDYAWQGTAHASPSTRTGLLGRSSEMLDWEPGESAWDFTAPLVQTSGLRLYCDEQRRWFLGDPTTPVDGQINITAGVNLTDGRDTISRSSDWFDAVVAAYSWNDATGSSKTMWDAAGAPGTKVLTLKHDRPYPGPGAAASVLDRSQGRGRVLDISALSDYMATPGMAVQATLPASPIQTGFVSAVTWALPADEMIVKSRGLTDTPATAWMFLAPGVKWTDSPVGASWTAETV